MPAYAFGGSFSDATIDTDRWDLSRYGSYSDDGVYLGYVRKDTTTGSASLGKYAKGGVMRLLTGDNYDLSTWKVSKVIDGTGPVASAVTKLQDKRNGKLWLYFGTGRYFFKSGSTIDEDYTSGRYVDDFQGGHRQPGL
jgi:type IV pilus assembly protein PilY1